MSRSRSRSPWASSRTKRNRFDAEEPGSPPEGSTSCAAEVERFLKANPVDPHAAAQLRACAPETARQVISFGALSFARDASAALLGRIRDAEEAPSRRPPAPPPRPGVSGAGGSSRLSGDVTVEMERFLAANPVDAQAEARFRNTPPHVARAVMDRGPISGTRNPASVLLTRIRDAENGRTGLHSGVGLPAPPPPRGDADPEMERLIRQYSLDARAAAGLRSLTPEQQRVAVSLPLHEARNPSAFIMAQLASRFGEAAAVPSSFPRRGVQGYVL